jgi:hypothetical protein
MPIRFPARRSDRSFCIDVVFRVKSGQMKSLPSRIAKWSDEWVEVNRHWKSKHPESSDGVLDFLRDFSGPPQSLTLGPDSISLRFEVRPESKRAWRDWLGIRFVKELRQAFPEITTLEAVRNCPHDRD